MQQAIYDPLFINYTREYMYEEEKEKKKNILSTLLQLNPISALGQRGVGGESAKQTY